MRYLSLAVCVLLLGFVASSAAAKPVGKGSSIIAIELYQGMADFATPDEFGAGFISAFEHSEVGVLGQYWYLFSDAWALNIGGGIGYFKETNKPGTDADTLATDFVYTQNSWNVRSGVERVVSVGEAVHFLIGPGIQVWSGKAKFEEGGTTIETESTLRVSLTGRVGAYLNLGSSVGIMTHVGFYMGTASVEDEGAKATWLPSGPDGAIGIGFNF